MAAVASLVDLTFLFSPFYPVWIPRMVFAIQGDGEYGDRLCRDARQYISHAILPHVTDDPDGKLIRMHRR